MTGGSLAVLSEQTAPVDWDAYVSESAQSGPYHQASMVEIGRVAFGLQCRFLTARSPDGRIRGVLPLVEQRGLLSGRRFVSLPFVTYGGILGDDDLAVSSLAAAAERLAIDEGVGEIEYRHSRELMTLAYPERMDKVSMVLQLPTTIGDLQARLGSKLRSQIRRAERVEPEVRTGRAELLKDFYEVFCSVMRDLGTPVYPLVLPGRH